jgi:hypothetical protein
MSVISDQVHRAGSPQSVRSSQRCGCVYTLVVGYESTHEETGNRRVSSNALEVGIVPTGDQPKGQGGDGLSS